MVRAGQVVYGFHQTFEGRKFLRFAYRRYIAIRRLREGPKAPAHGKVALIVADPQPQHQEKEDEKTTSALRRWADENQTELWAGDTDKTLRVMERLEELISTEVEIAEILEDRAADLRRIDFANAISAFFYPVSPHSRAVVRQALTKLCGVFSSQLEGEPAGFVSPDFKQMGIFYRAVLHDYLPLISIQEFTLSKDLSYVCDFETLSLEPLVSDRRAGFAFVGDKGQVIRFMVTHRAPGIRWLETWEPDSIPRDAHHLLGKVGMFRVATKHVNMENKGIAEFEEAIHGLHTASSYSRLITIPSESIVNYINDKFADIQWDIPI